MRGRSADEQKNCRKALIFVKKNAGKKPAAPLADEEFSFLVPEALSSV